MRHITSLFLLFTLVFAGCTKLEEEFRGELEEGQSGNINPAQLLRGAYTSLDGPFQSEARVWALQEHTSDEALGPTRGPDWDDNGVWRVLHSHTWNADHAFVRDTYRELLQSQFSASNVLEFNPSPQQAAEARFIRALGMFAVLDGWDQVPYREDLKNYKILPTTLKGTEAADFIASELNAIMADLPVGPNYVANKDAAKALLIKIYLNKGVFANRVTPTFAPADMTQVITLCDQLISSNKYTLATNFFDNFANNNDTKSTENIYTLFNQNGDRGGNVRARWFCGLHYNQTPSGWNGFATLSDFYDKFEAVDKRRGGAYTGVTDVTGMNVGFLVGQQKNQLGVDLKDRKNAPLAFTREVKLRETGTNLEVTGIRVHKYPPDYTSGGDQANNDYVIFRYADVLLMKAEAMLRSGNAAGGLTIVNQIRANRGATPLATLTLDNLLDERGRELYWEGWRRNDLVRFGKYLNAWQEKAASTQERLLFPIPTEQLAVNPNLVQNPGYN